MNVDAVVALLESYGYRVDVPPKNKIVEGRTVKDRNIRSISYQGDYLKFCVNLRYDPGSIYLDPYRAPAFYATVVNYRELTIEQLEKVQQEAQEVSKILKELKALGANIRE